MAIDDKAATGRPELIRAVPVRHPGRWVAVGVVLVLAAMFVHMLFTNPNLHWDITRQYFFSPIIRRGIVLTIQITVISMLIGLAGGVLLAVMRLSPNPVVSGVAWLYIWFFRGTPVLVQILFWYFIAVFIKTISIGIPFGPSFASWETGSLVTPVVAGILALGLNEAAYMAEIVRAGILAVDEGQTEAASALGMSRLLTMRRVVLPQAMRIIIPPTGNETISMLKTSSLVSTISVAELLRSSQIIYNRNFQTIALLIVASLWYIIMTTVLTSVQFYVERHFAKGSVRTLPPTPIQRLRANLFGGRRAIQRESLVRQELT